MTENDTKIKLERSARHKTKKGGNLMCSEMASDYGDQAWLHGVGVPLHGRDHPRAPAATDGQK